MYKHIEVIMTDRYMTAKLIVHCNKKNQYDGYVKADDLKITCDVPEKSLALLLSCLDMECKNYLVLNGWEE